LGFKRSISIQALATLGLDKFAVASTIFNGFPTAEAIASKTEFSNRWIGRFSKLIKRGTIR
jgi:hypothetical protein